MYVLNLTGSDYFFEEQDRSIKYGRDVFDLVLSKEDFRNLHCWHWQMQAQTHIYTQVFCFFDKYNVRKELVVDLGDCFLCLVLLKIFFSMVIKSFQAKLGGLWQSHINVYRGPKTFSKIPIYLNIKAKNFLKILCKIWSECLLEAFSFVPARK